MDNLQEVLELDIPHPGDPNYMKMISAKKDAAVAVVNLGLKANDATLRRRETDVLSRLLEAIQNDEGPAFAGPTLAVESRVLN